MMAAVLAVLAALLGLLSVAQCSLNTCAEIVKTEAEAKQAVQTFFSSDSSAARKLIASLRADGMTDEFLEKLKAGCRDCYVYPGREAGEAHAHDDRLWYVATSIAPREARKSIVLGVECASAVWLQQELYGG